MPADQIAVYEHLRRIWMLSLLRECAASALRFAFAAYVLFIAFRSHWLLAVAIVALPILLAPYRGPLYRPIRWLAAAWAAVVGPLAAPVVALGMIIGALTGRLNRPLFWSRAHLRALEPISTGGYRFEFMDERVALIAPASHGAGYVVTAGPNTSGSFHTLAASLSSVAAFALIKVKQPERSPIW